jgi:NADPH:quinone reductase-like Zn-dependent oxidoreductase
MRAIVFRSTGPLTVLNLASQPLAEPGKGEVRLRITSAGLNRADSLFREGRYFSKPDFTAPDGCCRLGFEGAGIVDAVGEGSAWLPGDRVGILPLSFDVSRNGLLAEYGIYPASVLVRTPQALDDALAGSVWMACLTAWGGLLLDGGLRERQTVVITAASSSVGIAAIQVANAIGAVPVAVTTSQAKAAALRNAGARHVFVMTADRPDIKASSDYLDFIRDLTGGKGSDLVFDAVAGPGINELIKGSARGGRIVVQGLLDRRPMDIHAGVLMKRLLTIKGYTVDMVTGDAANLAAAVEFVTAGLNAKSLYPVVAAQFTLEEHREAFQLLESNQHIGKIIINPHPA